MSEAHKAYEVGDADNSVQARFHPTEPVRNGPPSSDLGMLPTILQIAEVADGITPWSPWPGKRDRQLRAFYKSEGMLASTIYTLSTKLQALEYSINREDGGSVQAQARFQDVFAEADGGAGLAELVGKLSIDLDTQDNGCFIELTGAGRPDRPLDGSVTGVFHMDPAHCMRTQDPEYPVLYEDPMTGAFRKLHWSRVAMLSDMTQPNELARGVGYCATSRVLKKAQLARAINQYRLEKATGDFKRAIILLRGMTPKQAYAALALSDPELTKEAGFFMYRGVPVLTSMAGEIAGELLNLAEIGDGFNLLEDTTLYVYFLAMAFGIDAREIWPATASGATKADATVQHMKARGKVIGTRIQRLERLFNWRVLPPGLTFKFDYVDDEQDLQAAQIKQAKATYIISLASSGILNVKQAQALAVREGVFEEDILTIAPDDAEQASENTDDADNPDAERAPDPDAQAEQETQQEGKSAGHDPFARAMPPARKARKQPLQTPTASNWKGWYHASLNGSGTRTN